MFIFQKYHVLASLDAVFMAKCFKYIPAYTYCGMTANDENLCNSDWMIKNSMMRNPFSGVMISKI